MKKEGREIFTFKPLEESEGWYCKELLPYPVMTISPIMEALHNVFEVDMRYDIRRLLGKEEEVSVILWWKEETPMDIGMAEAACIEDHNKHLIKLEIKSKHKDLFKSNLISQVWKKRLKQRGISGESQMAVNSILHSEKEWKWKKKKIKERLIEEEELSLEEAEEIVEKDFLISR